jgi:hypothetical protein
MKKRDLSTLQGTLMSGNTPVALIENGEISKVIEPSLIPLHFLFAEDPSLKSWLRQRSLDTSRTNSRFVLRELDSDKADITQIVLSVNAATITDNFWIKENGSEKTYEQTRFHQDHLAKVALLGSSAGIVVPPDHHSPELTNTGTFEKCWHLENGQWWLYKKGNPEHTFSELAAQSIGRYLNINMAIYQYVSRNEIGNIFDCRAPASLSVVKTLDFTGGVFNFEPAADLGCSRDDAVKNYQILKRLSPAAAQEYKKMVLLDTLTYNIDRHLFNFGVLRDQTTGQVVSLAPIFDHNLSLSVALMDYEHIMADNPDRLFMNWRNLVDSQLLTMEPIKLPPINHLTIQALLEEINVPGFPDEDKETVIEILSFRGEKIQERVRQLNLFVTRQRQNDLER